MDDKPISDAPHSRPGMMEVMCPKCRHVQWESERAVSSNCRECGCYLKFKRPPFWKRLRGETTVTLEDQSAPSGPRFARSLERRESPTAGESGGQRRSESPTPAPVRQSPGPDKGSATAQGVETGFGTPGEERQVQKPRGRTEPAADRPVAEQHAPPAADAAAADHTVSSEAPAGSKRSTWLGPVERERLIGRETTPSYSRTSGSGGADPLPEAVSPLQRLKRKVLEQPPPEPPKAPKSPLRTLIEAREPHQAADSDLDADTSDAGRPEGAPAQAGDAAAELRARVSTNEPAIVRGRQRGHFSQGYFRDAVCFECGASHQTNRSAKASVCPKCGTRIQLEDLEINALFHDLIRTRGNVLVLRNGCLTRGPVECRDFVLQGRLECALQCSGLFHVRTDCELPAPVSCESFLVDRRVRALALQPLEASEAEILGVFQGDIVCSGTITVGPQGHVIGDITARAVKLETGGVHQGGMAIVAGGADPSGGGGL